MELYKIAVRALFAYVVLVALVRFSGKRSVSQLGAPAFIVTLIIGDLIDDMLWAEVGAGEFAAASGGVVVAALLVALATYVSPAVATVLEGRPQLVLRGGTSVRAGMRAERVNDKALAAMLRLRGIGPEHRSDVDHAWLEVGGNLSAVLREEARPAERRHRARVRERESR